MGDGFLLPIIYEINKDTLVLILSHIYIAPLQTPNQRIEGSNPSWATNNIQ